MGILWVDQVCYIWWCPNFFLLQGCLWFGCLFACSELMYRPCFSLTCAHTHTHTFLMELNTLWLSLFCWLPSHQLALLSLHLIIFTLRPLKTLWNNMCLMLAVKTKQTPTPQNEELVLQSTGSTNRKLSPWNTVGFTGFTHDCFINLFVRPSHSSEKSGTTQPKNPGFLSLLGRF